MPPHLDCGTDKLVPEACVLFNVVQSVALLPMTMACVLSAPARPHKKRSLASPHALVHHAHTAGAEVNHNLLRWCRGTVCMRNNER